VEDASYAHFDQLACGARHLTHTGVSSGSSRGVTCQ